MSRIGKKPIPLPAGVDATLGERSVTVKGPKGTLTVALHPVVKASIEAEPRAVVMTVAEEDSKEQKALWGLMRQLVANAVAGVQKPYERSLEFVGVGFKVAMSL
jgi:large subunit ribosomal protein L6